MERKFIFSPGEFYHIYSRGVEKRKIFLTAQDYERFLALLYAANSQDVFHLSDISDLKDIYKKYRISTLVDIGCYCLMTNHFHILIHEKDEKGISNFMSKLLTGYSMYFNKKYKRSGPLFVKPFRAEHINLENHLKYLFAYIHLNPLKIADTSWKENKLDQTNAKKFLSDYKYSSYLDFMGIKRSENSIINTKAFPSYFPEEKDFNRELNDWIEFDI